MFSKEDLEQFANTLLAYYTPIDKAVAEREIKCGLHQVKIQEIYSKVKAMKSAYAGEIAKDTADKLKSIYDDFL